MEEAYPMDETGKRRSNILIVDDIPQNIRMAASILGREGYRIAFDTDGKSALFQAKSVKFDLILLDIMMPEPDGYEVCRQLKDSPDTRQVPVIFLTAKTDTESIVRGFRIGASDYISKPFNAEELLARVNTHLELKHHRDHLENLVRQRTEELEEKSLALRVMLETRQELSSKIEEKITANIHHKILPLLRNFRTTTLTSVQKEWVNLMESGLGEVLSQFSQKLSSPEFDLTATEIRVATLIREGKSSKEISELLNISEGTVTFHRNNIRKKLGLTNRKSSLKAFLKALK